MSNYCVAKKPTPLLNTPEFQKVFGSKTLPLDDKGLLRSLEMVALPGTKFQIHRRLNGHILEVTTKEYELCPVYLDSRFVKPVEPATPERIKILPPKETILSCLNSSLGLPYLWGGNWGRGIPDILSLYQSGKHALHPAWTFKGVDCSGLLYEATSGFTPRNTSQLLTFGEKVISIQHVKPLDIIVWEGHVVILLSTTTIIESLYGKGVILSSLRDRIADLSTEKFVIRRFLLN